MWRKAQRMRLGKPDKTVAAILSRMEKMGVERANMQTSSLTLNPVWRQGKRYDDERISFESYRL